jgi:exodeoxyribonuclease III
MKILSWNVNGLRAVVKKNFFDDFARWNTDILCLQETKAQDHQVKEVLNTLRDYQIYSSSAEKPGYSGTAILTKRVPLNVTQGINFKEHDSEGRVLCLEFQTFFLVNVYVPNSGSELKRLAYRHKWDLAFFEYLKGLEKIKPVIACGDFNVAHKPHDLARPKDNYNKNAGYMQEEIDGMERLTSGGISDTFRHFYPEEKGKYTWWSYRAGVREKNIGWRIDYFLVSNSFLRSIKNAFILDEVTGSDHCPIGIEVNE